MDRLRRRWGLILAAGEGSRLRLLTTDAVGTSTPKQYCSLTGGPTLLEETVGRARRLVSRHRIVAVVSARHESLWRPMKERQVLAHAVVQPDNRGTAAGVVLPLLWIARRDPEAVVAVFPADHHVRDEDVLEQALASAFDHVERKGHGIVLLGLEPETPDSELGWIVPGGGPGQAVRRVAEFVEKPDAARARDLMDRGALWNSFLFVGRAREIVRLVAEHRPDVVRVLGGPGPVASLYDGLPPTDLSRDVFEPGARCLEVLRVPTCGWTDLGTPDRVARCLAHSTGQRHRPRVRPPGQVVFADALALA